MTDAELTVKNLRLLATHMETVPEDATRVFPAAEGTYWATSFSSYLSNDRTECVQRLNDTADLIEKEHVR